MESPEAAKAATQVSAKAPVCLSCRGGGGWMKNEACFIQVAEQYWKTNLGEIADDGVVGGGFGCRQELLNLLFAVFLLWLHQEVEGQPLVLADAFQLLEDFNFLGASDSVNSRASEHENCVCISWRERGATMHGWVSEWGDSGRIN